MIYDNPGLGSKLAFEAVKQFGWGSGAVKILKPSFIVFRLLGTQQFKEQYAGRRRSV